jgi:hypothetical protein
MGTRDKGQGTRDKVQGTRLKLIISSLFSPFTPYLLAPPLSLSSGFRDSCFYFIFVIIITVLYTFQEIFKNKIKEAILSELPDVAKLVFKPFLIL